MPEPSSPLRDESIRLAEERILFPETHRSVPVTIPSLRITVTFRPVPIKLARLLGRAAKDIALVQQGAASSLAALNDDLLSLMARYSKGDVEFEVYLKELSMLNERKSTLVPMDLDEQIMQVLSDSTARLLAFYGHTYSSDDLQERVTVVQLLDILSEQIVVNGENDFLLGPLRLIIDLARRIPGQYEQVASSAVVTRPRNALF